MTDPKTLIKEWAETVVVIGAALATVGGIVWAVARRNIDHWIVGALRRESALFKEVSAEAWSMDTARWDQAYTLAKETFEHVTRIEKDVTRLAERDEEFGELRADVTQLKRESEQQMELLREITKDIRDTRESVARIEGTIGSKPRRPRGD